MRRVEIITLMAYVRAQMAQLPADAEFLHVEPYAHEAKMHWRVDDRLPMAVRIIYRTTDDEELPDEALGLQHLASYGTKDGWGNHYVAHWWSAVPRVLTATDLDPQSSLQSSVT